MWSQIICNIITLIRLEQAKVLELLLIIFWKNILFSLVSQSLVASQIQNLHYIKIGHETLLPYRTPLFW